MLRNVMAGLLGLVLFASPALARDLVPRPESLNHGMNSPLSLITIKPDRCNLGPIDIPGRDLTDAEYDWLNAEIIRRQNCGKPEAKKEPAINYTGLLADFHFPPNACTSGPYVMPTGRLDTPKMEKMNRDFARRKRCEDALMLSDREAIDGLILSMGGTAERTGDGFHWQVTYECHCKSRIQDLLQMLERRDQDRINAYQADVARVQRRVRAQFGHN